MLFINKKCKPPKAACGPDSSPTKKACVRVGGLALHDLGDGGGSGGGLENHRHGIATQLARGIYISPPPKHDEMM